MHSEYHKINVIFVILLMNVLCHAELAMLSGELRFRGETRRACAECGGARLLELDLSVMSGCSEQLRQLATLYGRISSHLVYLERTIQAICEAWETVLLEMDSKMERFQVFGLKIPLLSHH